MKKIFLSVFSIGVLLAGLSHNAVAQEEEESASSFTVTLNQDIFFGFYPAIFGSTKISDGLDLTYYSILWTTPSFGDNGGGGDLWTEFGAGVSFGAGPLSISPALGILNGKLLSAGDQGRFFDGIVPNLTVDLDDEMLEGQFYLGYYKSILPGKTTDPMDPTKLTDVPSTNDFLHYWLNVGVKPTDWLSAGVHFEHLYGMYANVDSEVYPDGREAYDIYQWFGPYVQLAHEDGHSIRFVAGPQIFNDSGQDDDPEATFYKVTASFSF